MKPIIRAEGLSKQYRIGARQAPYATLRESLVGAVQAPVKLLRRNEASDENKIWALKDVSFEVMPGEVVGVIGRNGAGKSTLLKVLSRITEPTTGKVDLYGRVGSLLEVGTGFHSELTGRENIYLNGAVLGMKKIEIDGKFEEIVEFAEIRRFLDTPVKHYSTGMYMRLAFAVAAHLEPEILVIDEVLAVGDASFQKRCLGKMEAVAKQGRTVLFVSHNMTAVQSLCDRALWMHDGRVVADDRADYAIGEYLRSSATSISERFWTSPNDANGLETVRLVSARLLPENGIPIGALTIKTAFEIEIEYANLRPGVRLNVSIVLYNQKGDCVFSSTTVGENAWHGRPFPAGHFRSVGRVPGELLNNGVYRVALLLVRDTTVVVHREENLLEFEVHDDGDGRGNWWGEWPGVVRPRLEWRTEFLDPHIAEAGRVSRSAAAEQQTHH
jgi:lipopolysaccharide transport system ATP-binding protein